MLRSSLTILLMAALSLPHALALAGAAPTSATPTQTAPAPAPAPPPQAPPGQPPANWDQAAKDRAALEAAAEQARKEEEAVVAELFLLNRTLEEIRAAIARLDRDIARVTAEQADAERRRGDLEQQRKVKQKQFGNRARYYQENGSFAPLGFIISASSFPDFLFRIDILTQILARDARLIRELRDLAAKIRDQERLLAEKRAELAKLKDQQTAQAERQKTEIARKEQILAGLRDKRSGVEGKVAALEQLWNTSALPVLESISKSLRTVALRVTDLTPDALQVSLFPPGATVKVSEANLNAFIAKDSALKDLRFKLRKGGADIIGSFGGATLAVTGKFSIKSPTAIRYEPNEIIFQNYRLPKSVTDSLLSSGKMDLDYSELLGPWGVHELILDEGFVTVKAGLQ